MKVLVVADAPWILNEVAGAIGDPDIELREEADPHRVVEACADFGPDVAIVDMQVGNMGGMAITRALRDATLADQIPDLSIVLLLDRSADAFLAGRSGADAWIVKPITPQQLRAALKPAGVAEAN